MEEGWDRKASKLREGVRGRRCAGVGVDWVEGQLLWYQNYSKSPLYLKFIRG